MNQVGALMPKYMPCGQCSGGWVTDTDGQNAVRCWCWKQHVDRWIDFVRQHKSGKRIERQGS